MYRHLLIKVNSKEIFEFLRVQLNDLMSSLMNYSWVCSCNILLDEGRGVESRRPSIRAEGWVSRNTNTLWNSNNLIHKYIFYTIGCMVNMYKRKWSPPLWHANHMMTLNLVCSFKSHKYDNYDQAPHLVSYYTHSPRKTSSLAPLLPPPPPPFPSGRSNSQLLSWQNNKQFNVQDFL